MCCAVRLNNKHKERLTHWRKLQISVVIGHMVQHVSHGNHHRWVGGLLFLILVIVIVLFLWLLETTESKVEYILLILLGHQQQTKDHSTMYVVCMYCRV